MLLCLIVVTTNAATELTGLLHGAVLTLLGRVILGCVAVEAKHCAGWLSSRRAALTEEIVSSKVFPVPGGVELFG